MRTFMFFDSTQDEYLGQFVDNTSLLTNYEIIKEHVYIDSDGDVVFDGYNVDTVRVLLRHTPETTEGHFFEYKIGKICEITVN